MFGKWHNKVQTKYTNYTKRQVRRKREQKIPTTLTKSNPLDTPEKGTAPLSGPLDATVPKTKKHPSARQNTICPLSKSTKNALNQSKSKVKAISH